VPRRVANFGLVLIVSLTGCTNPPPAPLFVGTWTATDPGSTLTIRGNDTFTGNDGCNDLYGKGRVSGNTFTFGDITSTFKTCPAPPIGQGSRWLGFASTAKLSGNTLIIRQADGAEIGTLHRK
jgi:heat shock protein HslJ